MNNLTKKLKEQIAFLKDEVSQINNEVYSQQKFIKKYQLKKNYDFLILVFHAKTAFEKMVMGNFLMERQLL